jgi:hypothetical protein
MSVTPEDLAAFADGELAGERAAEVAAAIATDPALEAQVRAHRVLRQRLGAHFAPIIEAPLPERLTAPLHPPTVLDFAAARETRRAGPVVRWRWVAGPALAAALALAVFGPGGPDANYARGELAETLQEQLVATQPAAASTRILLSFRDSSGAVCRAFAGARESGIACRDSQGWRLVMTGSGSTAQAADYRMAGNPAAPVLERAQAMASGPALDAAAERAARERDWR